MYSGKSAKIAADTIRAQVSVCTNQAYKWKMRAQDVEGTKYETTTR